MALSHGMTEHEMDPDYNYPNHLSPVTVMVISWTLLSFALIMVATRLCMRVQRGQRHLIFSDIWLCIATVNTIGYTICGAVIYGMGKMQDFPIRTDPLLRVFFALNYFFDVGVWYPKFSIIAFYYHLIHPAAPMRKILNALTVYVACAALATFFLDTFWCGLYVPSNWSLEDWRCRSFDSDHLIAINWTIHIVGDILIFAFPFPVTRRMHLKSKREKAGLFATFALGLITMAVSTGRFVGYLTGNDMQSLYVWASSELCTSIVVVSLPALRPLVRRSGPIARFISEKVSRSKSLSPSQCPINKSALSAQHQMRKYREDPENQSVDFLTVHVPEDDSSHPQWRQSQNPTSKLEIKEEKPIIVPRESTADQPPV